MGSGCIISICLLNEYTKGRQWHFRHAGSLLEYCWRRDFNLGSPNHGRAACWGVYLKWVQILAPLLFSCETLSKFTEFTEPRFPCLRKFLWKFKKFKCKNLKHIAAIRVSDRRPPSLIHCKTSAASSYVWMWSQSYFHLKLPKNCVVSQKIVKVGRGRRSEDNWIETNKQNI